MSYGIEPRSLRYFIVVAELQNFNSASDRLAISQPALTKSIQKLEDQLQVPLFDRNPRGLELTPFGKAFLRHAKAIQGTFRHAIREIESMRESTCDTVLVGAGATWHNWLLPEALTRFHRTFPNVMFRIIAGLPEDLASQVRASQLDFAVAAFSRNWLEDQADPNFADMLITPLIDDDLVIVARKDHPAMSDPGVTLQDLHRYPWTSARAGTNQARMMAKLFGRSGIATPQATVESDEVDLRLGLVSRSDFLTFTSSQVLAASWSETLCRLDVPGGVMQRQSGLIQRRHATLSPATLALIEHIRAVCKQSPVQGPVPIASGF